MDTTTTISLNNGVKMPLLGLGTWKSAQGEECEQAVLAALTAGYRHIDTAAIYKNEESVGNAIKKSGIAREEIFITTKLWNSDFSDPRAALEESLKKLQTEYVDLYLLHWPIAERLDAWKILEELYNEGKCKAIGVSNFLIHHLKELLEHCEIVPTVNQVEFNTYLYQKDLWNFCTEKGIQLEAYSPLTRGAKLSEERLVGLAQKYKKTPAQMMIKWCLQKEIIVIPKSVTPQRIVDNANVFDFEISDEDMRALDALNENFRNCWYIDEKYLTQC